MVAANRVICGPARGRSGRRRVTGAKGVPGARDDQVHAPMNGSEATGRPPDERFGSAMQQDSGTPIPAAAPRPDGLPRLADGPVTVGPSSTSAACSAYESSWDWA
jgi:hypothetical protein